MNEPAAQQKSILDRQIRQGRLLLQQGQIPAAAQLAEQMLQSFGDDVAALTFASEVKTASGDSAGKHYREANDAASSVRYLERAHAQLGNQPQLMYDLASSQFFTGDFVGAKTTLDSCVSRRLSGITWRACVIRWRVPLQSPSIGLPACMRWPRNSKTWRPGLQHPSATDKPSATASAAQVRQPIHTRSVHKWQHYATQLAPLRARLTEHGVIAAE